MNNKTDKNKKLLIVIIAVAIIMVAVSFVTSTTYTQLAISSLLYPPLAYFAFRFVPKKAGDAGNKVKEKVVVEVETKKESERSAVEIVDIDKRAFLKMLGAAGFSFFIFSLFTRKVEDLLINKGGGRTSDSGGAGTAAPTVSPTEGYKVTEIATEDFNYYGFVNMEGNWYIMKEDPTVGSFRYSKGDTNFSSGWGKKSRLKYDYYHEVFD